MKSVIALSTLGLAAVFSLTVACDDGGVSVECESDADCANETDNTFCDLPEDHADGTKDGVCIAPLDPVCENDTDCDLQDVGTGSPIADTADFAGTCEDEDYVTITGFDGVDYCALEDSADFSCEDDLEGDEIAVTANLKAGGTASVCVKPDGTCSEDGQCS